MINDVVEFCRRSYGRGGACADCDNDCKGGCSACLRAIHRDSECNRAYNCANMCNWYVCQNMHKYASEIYYALNVLGLNSGRPRLNVCSIGCGPASELIAIEVFRKKHNQSLQYTFNGFDFNEYWNPIQAFVKSQTHNPDNVIFMNMDVFDHYRDSDDLPNMIILNYMLSDMLKMDFDRFNGFLDGLYNLFRRMPSGVLLINDINVGLNPRNVRYYYDRIAKRIKEENPNAKIYGYHFENTMKRYYPYGTQHQRNTTFRVPNNIVREFNPNTECHSAQLLIIKHPVNQ